MSDHLHTQPDEHLEARITAYVLGEASPFESAELEELISKSPELQIFLNRTRTLHTLLKEAETTSNKPAEDWKLSPAKREKLDALLGAEEKVVSIYKESRIRRASFRAGIGIAAIFVVTLIINRFIVFPKASSTTSQRTIITYMATEDEQAEANSEQITLSDRALHPNERASLPSSPQSTGAPAPIQIGGQVRTPGPVDFKKGTTLGEAVASAGGATEFGSRRRVKLYRNGKVRTYDLTNDSLASLELQPGDAIEMPQKNWLGCGASRDELVESELREERQEKLPELTSGLRSGDAAITSDSIDAILNNPNRTADADSDESVMSLAGTFGLDAPGKKNQSGISNPGMDAFAPEPAEETVQAKPLPPSRESIRKTDESTDGRALKRSLALGVRDDFGDGWGETAEEEEGYLDDPIRSNPALTDEHPKKVDQVRRSLYTAQGNYDLGKYDDAIESYEEVLRVDPYNSAARRGMEKVANTKSDYYRAAYDQTRSELLSQVDAAWELSVPADESGLTSAIERVDEISSDEAPKQIDITTKHIDISQSNDRDLGFDWLVDPFGETTGKATYLYGQPPIIELETKPSVGEFEGFINYGEAIADSADTNQFFATPSADSALGDKDGLLAWSRAADESSGIVPEVEIVREFIYPTEYLVPELANNQDGATPLFPVTPATPPTVAEPVLGDVPMLGRLFTKDATEITGTLLKQMAEKEAAIDLADLSQEIPATEEPFSTFSLNISDASFQIARAAMEKGEQPDPAAIKPEQFYNAVDYGDPAPSSLEPVAAAIDQTAHPVIPGRNLLRVALRTASTGRSAAQPLRLTLLVDQSGSMVRDDRRAAMETALEQLATLLTENDEVTVIGFSRTPRLLADSMPGDQAGKLPELINQTANEGGTNLEQAITLASELALRHKLDGAQNRIVLFTDGAANLGNANPERLSESIESLRQQSISFDIAGIGATDLNDNLLAELARHGNGRYYLVNKNTGASLAAQLAGAFRPAAENVKVQVVLNPDRVGNYKLIGFEKDRLKTEDFRNDSVDAAELAADEAGVAMYQVETLPEGTGEIGEVSVRFRDTATGEMVERTWTIPYEPSAPAIDKADPKTQLATLSLLAAQKLQGGPMADAINLRNFSETLAKLKQTYAKDAKTTQMLTFIEGLK